MEMTKHATKRFRTFEEAWQVLFEELPPDERLAILTEPKGERAARHAKDALLASEELTSANPRPKWTPKK